MQERNRKHLHQVYLIQENLVRQVPILMNQENTNTT